MRAWLLASSCSPPRRKHPKSVANVLHRIRPPHGRLRPKGRHKAPWRGRFGWVRLMPYTLPLTADDCNPPPPPAQIPSKNGTPPNPSAQRRGPRMAPRDGQTPLHPGRERTNEAGRRVDSAPGTLGPPRRPRSKGEPDRLPVGNYLGGTRIRPSVCLPRAWGASGRERPRPAQQHKGRAGLARPHGSARPVSLAGRATIAPGR